MEGVRCMGPSSILARRLYSLLFLSFSIREANLFNFTLLYKSENIAVEDLGCHNTQVLYFLYNKVKCKVKSQFSQNLVGRPQVLYE